MIAGIGTAKLSGCTSADGAALAEVAHAYRQAAAFSTRVRAVSLICAALCAAGGILAQSASVTNLLVTLTDTDARGGTHPGKRETFRVTAIAAPDAGGHYTITLDRTPFYAHGAATTMTTIATPASQPPTTNLLFYVPSPSGLVAGKLILVMMLGIIRLTGTLKAMTALTVLAPV